MACPLMLSFMLVVLPHGKHDCFPAFSCSLSHSSFPRALSWRFELLVEPGSWLVGSSSARSSSSVLVGSWVQMKLCKTTSPLISCDCISSEYSCVIRRTLKWCLMTPKMCSITLQSHACLLLNNSSGVCGLCNVTITVTMGAVNTLVHTYCCSNPIPSNGTSLHGRGLEVHLSLHTQHQPGSSACQVSWSLYSGHYWIHGCWLCCLPIQVTHKETPCSWSTLWEHSVRLDLSCPGTWSASIQGQRQEYVIHLLLWCNLWSRARSWGNPWSHLELGSYLWGAWHRYCKPSLM